MSRSTSPLFSLMPAVCLTVAWFAPSSYAATYYCLDPAGRPLFTDSPSQADQCVLVQEGRPTPPPIPQRLPDDAVAGTPPAAPPDLRPAGTEDQDGASPPTDAAPPGTVRVPIGRSGKSLIVQVRLNGTRDARLILDTGADVTILSHALALDLGIFPSASLSTVTLNTVGGQVRADVVRVGSVSVGEAEARDVLAVIHDLPDAPTGIDGLLGLTFLDRFVVTVDAQKGEMQLRQRR